MTDTTTHASAAPTTPDSTPVEWHTADADDRWPGRWTAHTAFDDPTAPVHPRPRESIEVRTIAFWD